MAEWDSYMADKMSKMHQKFAMSHLWLPWFITKYDRHLVTFHSEASRIYLLRKNAGLPFRPFDDYVSDVMRNSAYTSYNFIAYYPNFSINRPVWREEADTKDENI